MKKNLLLLCFATFGLHSFGNAQVITTLAGTGTPGFSGDNAPATAAKLNTPYGVIGFSTGEVFIADQGNNRIRRVDGSGIIATVVGTGATYFNGDSLAATQTNIQGPRGLAVDFDNNLVFTDYGNNRIRIYNTATHSILTVAGSATPGFAGEGIAANDPSVQVNYPWGICVDRSNAIYFADQLNCRVRMIDASGIIHTVAGNGTCFIGGDGGQASAATLQYPTSVATDDSGNVYIADDGNNRIRKINTSGVISTITGSATYGFTGDGGPATAAKVDHPTTLRLDGLGSVYFTDVNNNRIRKIDNSGNINTIAGNGTAGFAGDNGAAVRAQLNSPMDVSVVASAQKIYIADKENHRIRVIDLSRAPDAVENVQKEPHGSLTVFGNPCRQSVVVSPQSIFASEVDLTLSDLQGKVLKTYHLTANHAHKIDLNVPAGNYILKSDDGKEVFNERISVVE